MKQFLVSKTIDHLPYNRIDYSLLNFSENKQAFIDAAASFIISSWLCSDCTDCISGQCKMLKIKQNLNSALQKDRNEYLGVLTGAFFPDGEKRDEPNQKRTAAMAAFTETLLRWLLTSFTSDIQLIHPAAPLPSGQGLVDLIVVNGSTADYNSLVVTLWEIKSSDNQAGKNHNDKIYKQLDEYADRFYYIAHAISTQYKNSTDFGPHFKRFLRNMRSLYYNRNLQARFGVFVVYDESVPQEVNLVPNLHNHPEGYEYPTTKTSHTLLVLPVPGFRDIRLKVWKSLHLI